MDKKLIKKIKNKLLPLPSNTPIVIIYNDRVNMIKKWILKDIPFQVLDIDGGICLHPLILKKTLLHNAFYWPANLQ